MSFTLPEPDMFGIGFRAGYNAGGLYVAEYVDKLLFAWSQSGNTAELTDKLADMVSETRRTQD